MWCRSFHIACDIHADGPTFDVATSLMITLMSNDRRIYKILPLYILSKEREEAESEYSSSLIRKFARLTLCLYCFTVRKKINIFWIFFFYFAMVLVFWNLFYFLIIQDEIAKSISKATCFKKSLLLTFDLLRNEHRERILIFLFDWTFVYPMIFTSWI